MVDADGPQRGGHLAAAKVVQLLGVDLRAGINMDLYTTPDVAAAEAM